MHSSSCFLFLTFLNLLAENFQLPAALSTLFHGLQEPKWRRRILGALMHWEQFEGLPMTKTKDAKRDF
jgi:hypothetical protein